MKQNIISVLVVVIVVLSVMVLSSCGTQKMGCPGQITKTEVTGEVNG